METLNMQNDTLLLEYATGTIEADATQLDRLDEFTERLAAGEFFVPTDVRIVCDCVDGRCGAVRPFRPNSAGGTESIMVADDLTYKRFAESTDSTTVAQYQNTLKFLGAGNQPVGGHTVEGVNPPGSGCGANDKLANIYQFISAHGDVMRDLAGRLGIDVDQETHDMIVGNAGSRITFSEGSELLDALDEHPGAQTSLLEGPHREVLVTVNMRVGTTLDREAVREEFPDHQAFNVDAWALENTARLLSSDEDEVKRLVAAMVYYNLATAHVLGGRTLRIVVVR